jgi:hypothetical protein
LRHLQEQRYNSMHSSFGFRWRSLARYMLWPPCNEERHSVAHWTGESQGWSRCSGGENIFCSCQEAKYWLFTPQPSHYFQWVTCLHCLHADEALVKVNTDTFVEQKKIMFRSECEVATHSNIHIMYNVLIAGKLWYPVTLCPWRCSVLSLFTDAISSSDHPALHEAYRLTIFYILILYLWTFLW